MMVVTLANITEPGVVALISGVSGQRLGQEAAVAATFFEEKIGTLLVGHRQEHGAIP